MNIDDMEQDAAEQAANVDPSTLNELGQQAWALEQKIAESEATTKGLKKILEGLMMHDIPTALSAAGVDEFGFENSEGNMCRIAKEIKVRGSLNGAPDLDDAIAYLEDQGLSGVVRAKLEIDFSMDEEGQAVTLANQIEQSLGRPALLQKSIHPSTLTSFVRDKLKEDSTFDFAKVGCTAYPQARFTKRR